MTEPRKPTQVWAEALAIVEGSLGRATFDLWLRGTQPLAVDGEVWTIQVLNQYAVDWLSQRLTPILKSALVAAGAAGDPQFTFVVRPAESPVTPKSRPAEAIIEAVRANHVAVDEAGHAFTWLDVYVKLKVAFRRRMLAELKGAKLSVFVCLALHVDADGISSPGVGQIMRETDYSRAPVCAALEELQAPPFRLIEKLDRKHPTRGTDQYRVRGYAWIGSEPAPALFEMEEFRK